MLENTLPAVALLKAIFVFASVGMLSFVDYLIVLIEVYSAELVCSDCSHLCMLGAVCPPSP